MNGDTSLSQFNRAVDALLQHSAPADREACPPDERRDLVLAERLAAADFSPESRVRQSLRRRLLAARPQPGARPAAAATHLGWVAACASLLAVVIFLASPAGYTLAQSGVAILRDWLLGDNTRLTAVEGDFQVNPGAEGQPVLAPAGAEPLAPPEPGVNLGQPAAAPDFQVLQPAYLPAGYVLNNAVALGAGQVELVYVNPAEQRLLSILLTAVGGERGAVQIFHTSDIPEIEVDVNGHAGVWMPGTEDSLLVWEADGVSYQLTSRLSLDEALAVAESLR
jgi:hypothetical protein